MEPVCHPTCETKKETVHKYCCKCKDICIPGVTPICQSGSACCDNSGANGSGGATGCATCDPCQDGCDCRCRVRTVHKLMVCPETKEHCVKGCTVTWACPHCGDCGSGCGEATAVPSVAPATPGPTAPAPAPAPKTDRLPPAPKTTNLAPMPENIRVAGAGY
jgi:hypothetical protein